MHCEMIYLTVKSGKFVYALDSIASLSSISVSLLWLSFSPLHINISPFLLCNQISSCVVPSHRGIVLLLNNITDISTYVNESLRTRSWTWLACKDFQSVYENIWGSFFAWYELTSCYSRTWGNWRRIRITCGGKRHP